MAQDSPIPLYDWIRSDFSSQAREAFLASIGPTLARLIGPGSRVLDLGCGGGAVAFFLEDLGAQVTGCDLGAKMIETAREEARRRDSTATFFEADILEHDFGDQQYDAALLVGNTLQDIPHSSLSGLRDRVWRALSDDGRLVLDFFDGISELEHARDHPEETFQSESAVITRRFKGYDPSLGAYVEEYHNLSNDETFEYTSYIYTGPVIDTILAPRFAIKTRARLEHGRFLSVYGGRS